MTIDLQAMLVLVSATRWRRLIVKIIITWTQSHLFILCIILMTFSHRLVSNQYRVSSEPFIAAN